MLCCCERCRERTRGPWGCCKQEAQALSTPRSAREGGSSTISSGAFQLLGTVISPPGAELPSRKAPGKRCPILLPRRGVGRGGCPESITPWLMLISWWQRFPAAAPRAPLGVPLPPAQPAGGSAPGLLQPKGSAPVQSGSVLGASKRQRRDLTLAAAKVRTSLGGPRRGEGGQKQREVL